ncbi:MAG: C-terminal target protein [Flavipsychrobacter sp.]|jgi:uncharacterized protein YjdB|nr:C-terminal target protein [Flavipsychrobacter sp.]
MPDSTNIKDTFYALYIWRVKQHINNKPLCFVTSKMNVMRYVTLTLAVLIFSLCGHAQIGPITGPSTVCTGNTIILSDTSAGGTWSSSNTSIAFIGSSSGVVSGISAGVVNITYTRGLYTVTSITVNPSPAAISSLTSMCVGSNIPATNPTAGGTWSTTNPSVASISSFGVITGLAAGSADVQYTLAGGCAAIQPVTVNATPAAITGMTAVCAGNTTSLFNPVSGGTWTSSSPGVATVGSASGTVSAVSAGTAAIYYSINSCITSTYVTVNPLPAPISGPAGACISDIIFLADGTAGGIWSSSNPSVATVGATTGAVAGITAGTVTISYTLPTGCRTTRLVSVNPLPTAYTISPSMGSYCSGGSGVAVTLPSSQTGISYQLFRGTAMVGSAIPGTGAAVNFGMQTMAASYTIKATNPATGCNTVLPGTSNIAINPLPTQFNVTGGGAYCPGDPAYHVNLSGSQAGLNYQLYRGGSFTGMSIGGTGSALDFGIHGTAGIYTVVATNLATGCISNMNGSATIIVNSLPASHTVSLTDSTICAGSPGPHVQLNSTTVGIRYQLQINGINDGPPVMGSGPSYDFGVHSTPGIYVVTATDVITGCWTQMSGTPTLVVNPLPNTHSLTSAGSYCSGTSGARINLATSDVGISYQLLNGSLPSGSAMMGTGTVIDFNYHTSGLYSAIATNPVTGCTRSMTGTINVSVNPLPPVYTVSASASTYCSGGAGVMVSLSSSSTGVNYQLYSGSIPVGSVVTGTGSAINFGYQTAYATYTVKATNIASGCTSNMSGTPSIMPVPSPTAYMVMGDGSYCSGGGGINVKLASSQVGTNYWVYQGGLVTGTSLSGTGGTLDFGPRFVAGSYLIKAVNASNGCATWMTDSAVISVKPLPVAYTVTGGGGYCAGDSGVHIRLSGSIIGTNYQLMFGTTAVGLPLAGTGAALDFGLQTVMGTYTVIATDPLVGCPKTMNSSATVVINPAPSIFTVTGGGSYCSGGTGVRIGLGISSPGVTYRMYNGSTLAGTLVGTGSSLDFGLQTSTGVYTVAATNPSGCISSMTGSATVSITPTVTPTVSISTTPDDTLCTGILVTYTAISMNGGAAPTYQWTVNGAVVGTGASYSYLPSNADVVRVSMLSNAACPTPATVTDNVTMTVRPNPSVSGSTRICVGSSTNLTGTPGGVWIPGNPSIANVATIGTTLGVLTGMSMGITTISYSLLGCTSIIVVTVNPVPTVTASSSAAACGGTYNLAANGGVTYSWLPIAGLSCSTCATTIARPMANTNYTVTGTAATGCSSKAAVSVNGNRVSGHISYTGLSSDVFKVWLIHFNPSDSTLTGVDSTYTCMSSGTPYFEFVGKPANTYYVKAKLMGTIPGTSGYIPTYSLSTPYWYNAATATHTNATDSLHINMIYGTVPPGPGFIGGSISSGAGKGTSGSIPAEGMIVYLKDAVSNFILTYTYTDADGNYSFSNIAEGNYVIYPEEFLYNTTPSATIVLSPGADSAKNVRFMQYTTSRRIVPVSVTGVASMKTGAGNIHIYPNPTTGKINIRWAEQTTGTATLSVTNVVGQEVYNTQLNLSQPSGETQANLGNLTNGVYLLSVKGEHLNYTWRLVIEQ